MHPELPLQRLWTFNGTVPGQTYVARYGEPILVRNFNNLPANNGGFGLQSVSTHLHNGHTPSESDGFPCDFFGNDPVGNTKWYDQHYPNVLAGFASSHPPTGDINESMSTLWYHDHRVDFTAQNVYKGLAGFYLLFNQFDTGDETTGFRLPSFPNFDIPMMFNDKNFDPDDGILAFDLANRDGILGDKFLVNGKIQPFFEVKRRRYRFRWLNGGPSRFYRMYLTKSNLSNHPFWIISNDGNLLKNPVLTTTGLMMGVAERMDVIVDFSSFAAGSIIHIENRLEQCDGAGPTNNILPAGQGNKMLEFRVVSDAVTDNSVDPATNPTFYQVPTRVAERITRCFKFDRRNGQWVINDELFDCNDVRFRVKRNTAEIWKLEGGFDWSHPVHIHFEEHQVLKRKLSASDGSNLGTFPTGSRPVALAYDGENIWVANRFSSNVMRLQASDGSLVETIKVGKGPEALLFDSGSIWVANGEDNSVTKIRLSDGAHCTFRVGTRPIALAFDGNHIWVANNNSNSVTKLRADDGTNLGTFDAGREPTGLAFDGVNLWVANFYSKSVTRLNGDGSIRDRIAVEDGPADIGFFGGFIMVLNYGGRSVSQIDPQTGKVVKTFAVGRSPVGLAFDGVNIWVANGGNDSVSRVKTSIAKPAP